MYDIKHITDFSEYRKKDEAQMDPAPLDQYLLMKELDPKNPKMTDNKIQSILLKHMLDLEEQKRDYQTKKNVIQTIKAFVLLTQFLSVIVVVLGIHERKFVLDSFPGWFLRFCFLACVFRLLIADRKALLVNKSANFLININIEKIGYRLLFENLFRLLLNMLIMIVIPLYLFTIDEDAEETAFV